MSIIITGMKRLFESPLVRRGIALITHPFFRRTLALSFTLLTTVLLVQSSSKPILGPPAPSGHPDLMREIELTFGHIVAFGTLVSLWWWALVPNLPSQRALFVAVGFALIYGVITELAQSAVPDREVSLFDVAVNWCTTALTAVTIVQRQRGGTQVASKATR
jgi:VanZ family protein